MITGGLLGALTACGVLLVGAHLLARRRPRLEARVLPYLRDLTEAPARTGPRLAPGPTSAVAAIYGPPLRRAADLVERVLGGAESVRRRLSRAGLDRSVHDFRVEQVVWGLVGFAVVGAFALLRAWSTPGAALPLALMCVGGFALGVLLRDNRLTAQVRSREAAIVAEFPTVAELLALAVANGSVDHLSGLCRCSVPRLYGWAPVPSGGSHGLVVWVDRRGVARGPELVEPRRIRPIYSEPRIGSAYDGPLSDQGSETPPGGAK